MTYKIPRIIGIYKIECGEKIYIGQSIHIFSRWADHFLALIMGSHKNLRLQGDFAIYGMKSFTFGIIEICKKEELNIREKYYINQAIRNKGRKNIYNIKI